MFVFIYEYIDHETRKGVMRREEEILKSMEREVNQYM